MRRGGWRERDEGAAWCLSCAGFPENGAKCCRERDEIDEPWISRQKNEIKCLSAPKRINFRILL